MAEKNDKIRIELEIPRWCLEALARWKVPAEHCGAEIEERIAFLIDEQACAIESAEREEKAHHLYRQFNMRHPRDRSNDDELAF